VDNPGEQPIETAPQPQTVEQLTPPPVADTPLSPTSPEIPTASPDAKARRRLFVFGGIVAGVAIVGGAAVAIYSSQTKKAYVPAATPVASASLPNGWKQYRETSSGFAVQTPPDWTSVGYDLIGNQKALEKEFPQFAAKLKQLGFDLSQAADKLKFFAQSSDATTNMVILKQTGPSVASDEYLSEVVQSFQRLGVDNLQHNSVRLPGGQAERFTFSESTTAADGTPVTLNYLQYHLLSTSGSQSTVFVLQFITLGSTDAATTATFEQIANSFRKI
jgi:hypothetical protein